MNVHGRIVRRAAEPLRTPSGLAAGERPFRGVFYVRAESAAVRNAFQAECARLGIRRVRIANDVRPGSGKVVDAWECQGTAAALDRLTACGFVVDTHFVMDTRPPAFRTATYDRETGVRQSPRVPLPKDTPASTARNIREASLGPTERERREAAAERAKHPDGGLADAVDAAERAGRPGRFAPPDQTAELMAELKRLWDAHRASPLGPDDRRRADELMAELGIG